MNSLGGVFRVIPSTPRVVDLSSVVTDISSPEDHGTSSNLFMIKCCFLELWQCLLPNIVPHLGEVCFIC